MAGLMLWLVFLGDRHLLNSISSRWKRHKLGF
jgi:hypothetical protein